MMSALRGKGLAQKQMMVLIGCFQGLLDHERDKGEGGD